MKLLDWDQSAGTARGPASAVVANVNSSKRSTPRDIPGPKNPTHVLGVRVRVEHSAARYDPVNRILYRGRPYKLAGAKLPPSYSDEEKKTVDEVLKRFGDALIASLEPQKKPVKDFGRALSYALETLYSNLGGDPAISVVEPGNLPKELRRRGK